MQNTKKMVKLHYVFLMVLAGAKTHVRQTIGIAVRKRTPRHEQIQVRNSTFKIDPSLGKKRVGHLGASEKNIRPVTKIEWHSRQQARTSSR